MARFTIIRKVLSVARSYVVNDNGAMAFHIGGKLRFARVFTVRQSDGRPLLTVREKLWALDPVYIIAGQNADVAIVRRTTTSGARVDRFRIELGTELLFEASGRLGDDAGVAITRSGSFLSSIRRVQETFRETFEWNVPAGGDHALLLAVAMSIAEADPARGRASSDGLQHD